MATRKRRGGKPLTRRSGRRPELRTILVFCEGVNSEPDYVKAVKRLPRVAGNTALDLRIHPERGVPLTLVQMAAAHMSDPEVDECWCIFDVESPRPHPNLTEAKALARKNGVHLAISNPCFELWLILHFQDWSACVDTGPAERRSRELEGRPGKSIDGDLYMSKRQAASRRAERLDERHERNSTAFPHDNPSSGMYKFLRAVESGS